MEKLEQLTYQNEKLTKKIQRETNKMKIVEKEKNDINEK